MSIKDEGYLSISLLIKFAHILSDMCNSFTGRYCGKTVIYHNLHDNSGNNHKNFLKDKFFSHEQ